MRKENASDQIYVSFSPSPTQAQLCCELSQFIPTNPKSWANKVSAVHLLVSLLGSSDEDGMSFIEPVSLLLPSINIFKRSAVCTTRTSYVLRRKVSSCALPSSRLSSQCHCRQLERVSGLWQLVAISCIDKIEDLWRRSEIFHPPIVWNNSVQNSCVGRWREFDLIFISHCCLPSHQHHHHLVDHNKTQNIFASNVSLSKLKHHVARECCSSIGKERKHSMDI